MPINIEEKRYTKEDYQHVTEYEPRVAVNMNKVKSGYNADYYSVEATKSEMSLIDSMLQNLEVGEISEWEREKLRTRQGRNASHLLVNRQKFAGDSKLMKDIKAQVAGLEKHLNEKNFGTGTLDQIERKYLDAIAACNTYIENKNPWFATGIARKQAVIEQKERLEREYRLFTIGREAYKVLPDEEEIVYAMDLISLGRRREATIASTMGEYRKYFQDNLMKGDVIYRDMCKKTDNEVREKPELSPVLQQLLNNALYQDHSIYNAVDMAQKKFKSSDAPHVADGRMFMQYNYLDDLEKAHETMQKNAGSYKENKTLFDAAYKKLTQCAKTGDSISFIMMQVLTFKMSATLSDEEQGQLENLMEYYNEVISAVNVMGGTMTEIIKKLSASEPLSPVEEEAMGGGLSDNLTRYHRAVFKPKPAPAPVKKKSREAEDAESGEIAKGRLDAYTEKIEKRLKEELMEKEKKQ